MKTSYILSGLVLFIALFTGCTKILDDFTFVDKDPKIAVQARFSPDSISQVFVSRSLDMFDRREIKAITNATVSLIPESGDAFTLTTDSNGWYNLPANRLIAGSSYRISIVSEGYLNASADFSIPVVPEISRVDTSKIKEISGPYSGLQVKGVCELHFSDNPDTEDYYVVYLKKYFQEYQWDDFADITDTNDVYRHIYISSNSPYLSYGYSTSMGYGYASNDYYDPFYTRLIFSDRLFNGQTDVTIEILLNISDFRNSDGDEETEQLVDFYFATVDKPFYEYVTNKSRIQRAEGNPLAEPVTPYSNIENGFGLVYGYNERKIQVDFTGLFTEDDYNHSGGWWYYE